MDIEPTDEDIQEALRLAGREPTLYTRTVAHARTLAKLRASEAENERLRAELQAIVHNWEVEKSIWQPDIDRIKDALGGDSAVIDHVKSLRAQLAAQAAQIAGLANEIDSALKYVATKPAGLRLSLLVQAIRETQDTARTYLASEPKP